MVDLAEASNTARTLVLENTMDRQVEVRFDIEFIMRDEVSMTQGEVLPENHVKGIKFVL